MASRFIGVVSDTHGLVRPQTLDAVRGAELIIHAGDIGKPTVLEALERVAPVAAIRGNVDREAWAAQLPDTRLVEVAGRRLYVIHDLKSMDLDPAAAGIDVVIGGHSHKPAILWKTGVLYLNPGSCGPRRFRLPVSAARLWIDDQPLRPELVTLAA